VKITLTSEEKDQMILRLIRRKTGRWLLETHEGHVVLMAPVMRSRPIEQILADENLLTDQDTMLESM
jgi:hypothetical protein